MYPTVVTTNAGNQVARLNAVVGDDTGIKPTPDFGDRLDKTCLLGMAQII